MAIRRVLLVVALGALTAAPAAHAGAPVIGKVSVVTTALDHFTVEAPVDPSDSETSVHLEFGETRSLGGQTSASTIAAGSPPSPFTFRVNGLQAHTTYYFRFVATNASGTTATAVAAVKTTLAGRARVLRATAVQFAISTAPGGAYPWKVLAVLLPRGVPAGTHVSVLCRRACRGGGHAVTGHGRRQLRFRHAVSITRASVLEIRETLRGYIGRVRRFVFRGSGSLIESQRTMNRCLKAGRPIRCPG